MNETRVWAGSLSPYRGTGAGKMRSLPVILIAFLLVSCDTSLCGNEFVKDFVSPDGEYVASVFQRNCGATTPYVEVVSLRSSGKKFVPDDFGNWVFTLQGKAEVKISWIGERRLEVSYSGTGDQPTKRTKWKDVSISFD